VREAAGLRRRNDFAVHSIWNGFLLGLIFSSPGSQSVTVALNNLVGSQFGEKE
jgi:ABC-type glycerol-3-phosphate transport system permease component